MNKVLLSCALLATCAFSFDEQREGFLISVGVGLASVNTELSYLGSSADEDNTGFATSFKLGYGISNQLLVYYVNDVSWFSFENDDDTYTAGHSGIGFSYYIGENEPFYLLAGVGLGTFSNFTSGESDDIGSAYSLGLGYEVSPHIQLEAVYQSSTTENQYNNNIETTNSAFRVTVNYMWY